MTPEMYARVVFDSPLPALDKEFEYFVPAELLTSIAVGQRVNVKFANRSQIGFIVGLSNSSEFTGQKSSIASLVSEKVVLLPHIYQLVRSVAERQCSSVGELLGAAVPKRAVRVENNFKLLPTLKTENSETVVRAELCLPVSSAKGIPRFVERLVELALSYYKQNISVLVCVPDFRDVSRFADQFAATSEPINLIIGKPDNTASDNYLDFLNQTAPQPVIVLGTRSSIYSPIPVGSALIIWDDGDQSHQNQQSPYLNTRDIALIRQRIHGGSLHFLSHSRSTEIQRLVNIGYIEEGTAENSWRPKVVAAEGKALDGITFKLIKRALERGPVLFQVASPGVARSLYCEQCTHRAMCKNCNGPLWIASDSMISCRWCGVANLDFKCRDCGSGKLRQYGTGSTLWTQQLGKSFAGVPIREVVAAERDIEIPNKPMIVICTAGIEPLALNGYAGVVLMDCETQLHADSLRAPEDALRIWLNTLSFMRESGEAVAVGMTEEVSKALLFGQVRETINSLLEERESLGFPPARRVFSAQGSLSILQQLAADLEKLPGLKVLGIASAKTGTSVTESRLVATFPYSAGDEVATKVKHFIAQIPAKEKRVNPKSNKLLRPVTIKFDDPRVI